MSCLTPILRSSSMETFGFFITEKSKENLENIQSSDIKINNLVNFLGYIPLVGILIGIIRFIITSVASDAGYKNAQRVRAGFEIAGCGSLLLIPDLIMTLYRNFECCTPKRQYIQVDWTN